MVHLFATNLAETYVEWLTTFFAEKTLIFLLNLSGISLSMFRQSLEKNMFLMVCFRRG